jgi:hypothetical protein
MIKYLWEDSKNKNPAELREKYNLEQIVESGKDEFEKQLLLKSWVNQILPLGYNPKKQYKNSLEILEDSEKGQFYCSHYSLVYIQCATALGWYSRKLGIDYYHEFGEEEKHHGIADIWSNQFKKWFVVDAMHNLHFEKDKVPLNACEIRQEYLKNRAKDVAGIIGNYQRKLYYSKGTFGFDQPSNYFWFFILLRNNFFEDPDMYNGKSLLLEDKYNQDKIWYKGGGTKGESCPHPQYKNQFIKTNDPSLCFPEMYNFSH